MLFGLRHTPGTFRRTMDVIVRSVKWQFGHVYLDDIVVFSETHKEHIDHVRKVHLLLFNAEATIELKSFSFPTI